MDPQARLDAARDAADRGDYERALREHVWFHEHALEHDPAYCGVRLSFALGAWADLAKVYPPARDALVRIRDAQTARLLQGEGGWETFDEVEAINSHLDDRRATYELFRQLRESQPAVADACAELGWETAAAFGDFVLARACIDDPSARVAMWADELNENISVIRDPSAGLGELGDELKETISSIQAELPGWRSQLEDETIAMFAERVALLLRVLSHVGEADDVPALRDRVLDAVEDSSVRDRAHSHLESGT